MDAFEPSELLPSAVETLPLHVAVLDRDGTILLRNDAWERFAAGNHGDVGPEEGGANYLATLEAAESDGAERAAEGLRAVLTGERDQFELEYPCHDPDERRWFQVAAASFVEDGDRFGVVAHQEVTDRVGRRRALDALHETTRSLMTADSERAVADLIADAAAEILQFSYAGVHTYDPATDALAPVAWTDRIESVIDEPPALDRESLAWRAYSEGETLAFDDVRTTADVYNPDTPFRAELLVPLGTHGVVIVSAREPAAFDADDRQLVEILASNATVALDRLGRESTLREQKRALRSFEQAVERSGHSIVITDAEGVIEYVNPAFEELTGYTAAEAEGNNPRILKSGEHDEAFYRAMWETIRSGEVWDHEIVNECKDGTRVVVDQTIAPIVDADGEIERFVAVNHDITELKDHQQRLQAQRDKLEVLNQVVRHDIRNDLQVVRARGELVEQRVEPAGEAHVDALLGATDRAIDLTATARDLTESMLRSEIDPEPMDLQAILTDQLAEARSQFESAEFSIDGALPAVTVAADEMLPSIFANLLKNAVIHNDADTPEVTVSATRTDGVARIRVADNGPGVPDAQKGAIFGKDQKGLESAGTGLGLYLVNTLVEQYGGDVRVRDRGKRDPADTRSDADDADPRGSVFVVELPTSDPDG